MTEIIGPIDGGDLNRPIQGIKDTLQPGKVFDFTRPEEKSVNSCNKYGISQKDDTIFSPDIKESIKETRREAIHIRNIRDDLETKLLFFVKKQPSHEEIQQTAKFAASAIWDILKKVEIEIDNDETAAMLLALLLKIHSEYTFLHAERVMEWSVELAKEMGITDEKELNGIGKSALLKDIGTAGSAVIKEDSRTRKRMSSFIETVLSECGNLHDIGKMQIPSEILEKTAPLTDEEFEIIKTHPLIGVEIVRMYPALSPAIPGIKHHHEKYDGSGYPDRLKGDTIPFSARIITVTDTFDAMTEDRPYRKALTPGEAFRELIRLSGKQFDPEIVVSFTGMMLRKGNIKPEDIDTDYDFSRFTGRETDRDTVACVCKRIKELIS